MQKIKQKKTNLFNKIPKIFPQLSDIVNKNFIEGEVDLNLLIDRLSLFCILEDRTVLFIEKVTNIVIEKNIASFCFYDVNGKILNLFATKDEYKNKKYGKQLLQKIILHVGKCFLHVRISNSVALNLYKSLNFHIICQIKDYYMGTNVNEDAYMMEYNSLSFHFNDFVFDFYF